MPTGLKHELGLGEPQAQGSTEQDGQVQGGLPGRGREDKRGPPVHGRSCGEGKARSPGCQEG